MSGSGTTNVFAPVSGNANTAGVFTATVSSTLAQSENIIATLGSVQLSAAVTFVAGSPNSLTFAVSPTTARADGLAQIGLSTTVYDAYGNLVPNCAMTYSASGSKNTFSPATGTTNASGVLTSSVVATLAQTESVTVRTGALSRAAAITFTTRTCSYSAAKTFTVGNGPTGVSLIDVNRDAILDMISSNQTDGTMSVLLGTGSGNFSARVVAPGSISNPYSSAGGDVNGDGNIDIVVAVDTGVAVYTGKSNGTFNTAVTVTLPGNNGYDYVALDDVNNDGKLDLWTDDASLTLGTANSSFFHTATSVYVTDPNISYDGAIGDVNGDGNMDIVGANFNGGVGVILGKGNGKLNACVDIPGEAETEGIRLDDMNGDGKLDIIAASWTTGHLDLLVGNGNGTFQTYVSSPCGTNLRDLGVGDVDNDGIPDAVGADFTSNTICMALGTGNPAFPFFSATTQATGLNPYRLQVEDLNGDGKADVVVVNSGTNTANVFIAGTCSP